MQRLKAGFTRKAAAAFLRVTERTLRNWETGRVMVPYSAFEMVRVIGGYELPGPHWKGFFLHGDLLWSPEGKSFSCYELAYWGLTCSLARDRLIREGIAVAPGLDPRIQLAMAGLSSTVPVLSHDELETV